MPSGASPSASASRASGSARRRSTAATDACAAATCCGACRAAATRSSPTEVVLEDPFGLERVDVELDAAASILVYPRLVDARAALLRGGRATPEGRRLLLRRATGFDLHSVRDHQQGESLRRVHWPSTAKRGHLMVKELEDSPRDESAVLLDADAAPSSARRPTRASSSPCARRARS